MSPIDAHRLEMIVCDALERTAMVVADPTEPGAHTAPPTRFAALEYSGYARGRVILAASDGFARELASGILGCDPDRIDPATAGQDALNELANIVGGSITLALGGDTHAIRLHLPETAAAIPDDAPDAVQCALDSMGEPLRVIWVQHAAPDALAA